MITFESFMLAVVIAIIFLIIVEAVQCVVLSNLYKELSKQSRGISKLSGGITAILYREVKWNGNERTDDCD